MRPKHRVDNMQEMEMKVPDCCICIHRNTCERYAENSFCGRFASREPAVREPDPNRLWETGEEVDF